MRGVGSTEGAAETVGQFMLHRLPFDDDIALEMTLDESGRREVVVHRARVVAEATYREDMNTQSTVEHSSHYLPRSHATTRSRDRARNHRVADSNWIILMRFLVL